MIDLQYVIINYTGKKIHFLKLDLQFNKITWFIICIILYNFAC